MSGSPDRLQPATPELQRDFDQKKIRTEQILQALDVESQLQDVNRTLYGGQGKIVHIHEVMSLDTKGYGHSVGSYSSTPRDEFILLSGIALQTPETSDIKYKYGWEKPPLIFVGSGSTASVYRQPNYTKPDKYETNGISVHYFEPSNSKNWAPGSPLFQSSTIAPGYNLGGFMLMYHEQLDIPNPYDSSSPVDSRNLTQQKEQLKEMLGKIAEWEKMRLKGDSYIPGLSLNALHWNEKLQEQERRRLNIRMPLNSHLSANPALGHAQAAQQAEMARRAREYAQRTGTGTSSELPTPYNPPTTTPEWRGTQPSNRPGPIDPATGRPRPPQKPPGW